MDKELIKKRFGKSLPTYASNATVQNIMAKKLAEHLINHRGKKMIGHYLEIGCGSGVLTKHMAQFLDINFFYLNDICPEINEYYSFLHDKNKYFCIGDAEAFPFPKKPFDLITSSATLQWLEDPMRFLSQLKNGFIHRHGWIAISCFGKNNLKEIRDLTQISLKYPSCSELKKTLDRHFEIIYMEEEEIPMIFKNPIEVLRHLQKTGVTGTQPFKWNKYKLHDFETNYISRFSNLHKEVTLTYNPIYFIIKPLQNEKK